METAGTPPQAAQSGSADRRPALKPPRAAAVSQSLAALRRRLRCLACGGTDLHVPQSAATLECQGCAARYPVFRSGERPIPWLFANAAAARLQWKARYNGFLQSNSLELERLRQARAATRGKKSARRRINHLLQARERYRNQIVELLAPLGLEDIDWPADSTGLLQGKLAKNQGLSSYTSNVFRDWAWLNGENEALLEAVARVIDADPRSSIGHLLTLGAGACRLPYDLHRRYAPQSSVALDINPLLLQIGSRIIQGDLLSLYEFPIAPLDRQSFAVLQECEAPAPIRDDNFHFVMADALDPPFAGESFDTVLTPWLIDIVPQDLRVFLPRINQCLVPGGVWINSGPLAFFHQDETWCYSEEELFELIAQCGFEILAAERRGVAYLKSPHSAHGRSEEILSFAARKVQTVESVDSPRYLPCWLLDTSASVPSSPDTAIRSSNHLLKAQILAAVDGKRSIAQIGRKLARQYGLGTQETIHAVRQVLVDAWEDGMSSRLDCEN